MTRLSQTFTIHPVGQGFFYTGELKICTSNKGTTAFNFVFDCGSLNKNDCEEEVDIFRKYSWSEDEPLDLLIISHFDSDHVNFIGYLLSEKSVKRIISPFLNFEERLYLSLRNIPRSGYDSNNDIQDFTLRVQIDPIGTLNQYLSEGGDFTLFNNDPETSFPPDEPLPENFQFEFGNDAKIVFDFGVPVKDISTIEKDKFKLQDESHVKLQNDTSKNVIKISNLPLMGFLFHRKSVSENERLFYQNVYYEFIIEFNKEFKDSKNPTFTEIIDVIKSIKSAARVSNIFKRASKGIDGFTVKISELKDLNTTALNLLHYNLLDLNFLKRNNRRTFRLTDLNRKVIRKFSGARVENIDYFIPFLYFSPWLYFLDNYEHEEYVKSKLFNTFLTSDSNLLNDDYIIEFFKKYKNYWNRFSLFQIPHHGSVNNTGQRLLSILPKNISTFINYGSKNTFEHPSREIIQLLMLTGHSNNLIAVNEFSGLQNRIEFLIGK